VRSRPPKVPRSEDDEQEYREMWAKKEREVSESFMAYLSSKGAFEDWEENKETFRQVNVSLVYSCRTR
jgi:hypothetical protein